MNIEELRARAVQTIKIPGFSAGEAIEVKVQKPRILAMMAQGQIPNPLMSVALRMVGAATSKKQPEIADVAHVYELLCLACLVSPTYEQFKDIITDAQMNAIFAWGMGDIEMMSSFRPDQENGPNHQHGEGVRLSTK